MTCDFHGGVTGHSIEGCKALKDLVQDMIDKGKLSFEAKMVKAETYRVCLFIPALCNKKSLNVACFLQCL